MAKRISVKANFYMYLSTHTHTNTSQNTYSIIIGLIIRWSIATRHNIEKHTKYWCYLLKHIFFSLVIFSLVSTLLFFSYKHLLNSIYSTEKQIIANRWEFIKQNISKWYCESISQYKKIFSWWISEKKYSFLFFYLLLFLLLFCFKYFIR